MESYEIENLTKNNLSQPSGDTGGESLSAKAKKHKLLLIIGGISLVAIIVVIVLVCTLTKEKDEGSGSESKEESGGIIEDIRTIEIDGRGIEYKSANFITEDKVIDFGEFTSSGDKETVFLVMNGTLTIKNVSVNKTGTKSKQQKNLREEPFIDQDYTDEFYAPDVSDIKKADLQDDTSIQPTSLPDGSGSQPPEKPDESDSQPPEKKSGSSESQPPEKPDGEDSQPPEKKSGSSGSHSDDSGSHSHSGSGGGGQPGGDDDNYSFYGINSAIVVIGKNSKAIIENVKIYTDSYGSNAVVAVNEGEIEIKNCTIETKDSSSRGLHATYKGKITANNVQITTIGGSCANLATDRGEGTVIAHNMKLSTSGSGSPLIYSTGDIQVYDSLGKSNGAQIAVVEGKNSARITNCNFTCTGAGNRGDVDIAGIMVYQSMSGDASEGKGSFYTSNSNLEIIKSSNYSRKAPMIFVTNTDATILINKTNIIYGSGIFLDVKGTSEWGQEGQNGGRVNFTVIGNNLFGSIEADDISSINFFKDENVKNITYDSNCSNINVFNYTD